MLTYHVLGPLEVRSDGRPVRVSGRKPRMLLASLLLDAGHVVPADRLVEALWPGRPPRSAHANVRTYVSSLRAVLGSIRAEGSGYAIDLPDGSLDLQVFEELVSLGESAAALALWRGTPLSDLPECPLWARRVGQILTVRLRAAEDLVARLMAARQYGPAAEELRTLICEHPYREDLWQRLMIALHASGREAEALRAFHEVRELLVAELGVEPGAELRRSYQAILGENDPASPPLRPASPPVTAHPRGPSPQQVRPSGPDAPEPAPKEIRPSTPDLRRPAREQPPPGSSDLRQRAPQRQPPGDSDLRRPTPRQSAPGSSDDRMVAPLQVPGVSGFRWLASPRPGGSGHGWPAPQQVPPGIPDFVGRADELATLAEPYPLTVITGQPGIGKSTLAIRHARLLKPGFPAGQLHLALGDREPEDLLGEALRALGLVPSGGLHERAASFRSHLADRPMLLLLDDARDAEQVTPLLPGDSGTVVVTSRRRISTLPGARLLHLGPLSSEESLELLQQIVGPDRLQDRAAGRGVELDGRIEESGRLQESGPLHEGGRIEEGGRAGETGPLGEGERVGEAAWRVVAACGGLPLAIRDAGARLLARPGWSLETLALRLAEHPFTELRQVRATVGRSFRGLPGELSRAFATLGLLGPRPVPEWLLAALLPGDLSTADLFPGGRGVAEPAGRFGGRGAVELADLLVDASLLEPAGTDHAGRPRYRLPEMVSRLVASLPPDPPTLARILDGWTVAAQSATGRLPTTVFTFTASPAWQPPGTVVEQLTADPLAWFEAEHETLAEAVRLAATTGAPGAAWGLAAALVPYYDLRCHLRHWHDTHTTALSAAQATGDRYGEAAMLRGLGQVSLYRDRYTEATERFTAARRIFRELGDTRAEAVSICGLGAVSQFRRRPEQALRHFQAALAMFLALEDRGAEAYVRQAVGRVWLGSGDLDQASAWLGQAMRLARELGDPHREGCVSVQTGRLHELRAEPERAMSLHSRALDLFDGLGDRHCGAYAMQGLAGLHVARGEWAVASARLERARAIFKELGDRSGAATSTEMLDRLPRP